MVQCTQVHHAVSEDVTIDSLSPVERRAVRRAQARAQGGTSGTYNPYSGFYVFSCVFTTDGGTLKPDTNSENAAFTASMCSERKALYAAEDLHGDQLAGIVIMAQDSEGRSKIAGSCGECRQVMWEFACRSGVRKDFVVIMATTDLREIKRTDIGRMLPLAFGPEDLQRES